MNKNPTVDSYMEKLENPHQDTWEQIREIILHVDPKMEEDNGVLLPLSTKATWRLSTRAPKSSSISPFTPVHSSMILMVCWRVMPKKRGYFASPAVKS